jgi:HSP20 family protein
MDWDKSNDLPAINVKEEPDAFYIEVAAPGMKKEDFNVQIENGVMVVSATSKDSTEEKEDQYVRKEFNYMNFKRSFWLPESVNPEKIEAKYDKGLLNLRLAKSETHTGSKAKIIPIQ